MSKNDTEIEHFTVFSSRGESLEMKQLWSNQTTILAFLRQLVGN